MATRKPASKDTTPAINKTMKTELAQLVKGQRLADKRLSMLEKKVVKLESQKIKAPATKTIKKKKAVTTK